MIAVIAALGGWLGGRGPLAQLLAFAGAVLALGVAAATLLRGWLAARARTGTSPALSPAALAALLALGVLWFATGPLFQAEVASVRLWLGGSAEAHRQGLAHQVYAAYRRADPDALLAYNIGPRNGGLRAIMTQYGARDFVTIQPYLQHLPRDYPIRVLSAALAYRLWRSEGRLPRYEDGDNALHIQSVGIPGLSAAKS